MGPKIAQDPAVRSKSGFDTPPTTASEWEASSIGALTSTASELESVASGSGVETTSADEEGSADDTYDGQPLEHDGDITIVELEQEDAVLLSTSGPSRRRKRIARPSIDRALSDIDSGAEVDDEREAEDEASSSMLRQRVAGISLDEAAGSPQSQASSRNAVSHRSRRPLLNQPRPQTGSKGWRLPERTFAAWVLAT